jgi:hypothetical protein
LIRHWCKPGNSLLDANTSWLGTNPDLKAVTIDESVDGAYNIGLGAIEPGRGRWQRTNRDVIFHIHTTLLLLRGFHFDFANVKMIDLAQTELLVEPQEDSVQVMPATGIDAPVTSSGIVSSFPNPSNGWVTMQWSNEQAGTILLQILNPIGQIVLEQPVSNQANENKLTLICQRCLQVLISTGSLVSRLLLRASSR